MTATTEWEPSDDLVRRYREAMGWHPNPTDYSCEYDRQTLRRLHAAGLLDSGSSEP